jgi:hypothetical protein
MLDPAAHFDHFGNIASDMTAVHPQHRPQLVIHSGAQGTGTACWHYNPQCHDQHRLTVHTSIFLGRVLRILEPTTLVKLLPTFPSDLCADSFEESSDDEHFSDASEGKRKSSRPQTPVSPIPKTRVERVDDEPAHGEVPGTPAYGKRMRDAVPDEIEVVPEGRLSKRSSQIMERSHSPGGTLIPRTVVEKVDPTDTRYGDDPSTRAWHHRKTDSVPDLVLRSPAPGEGRRSFEQEPSSASSHTKIPETIITPVDPNPPSNPFPSGMSFFFLPIWKNH